MIDLAILTASLAHDRVADQFAVVTAAAPRGPVRRAVRAPRAVADRLEPTPQT